MDKTTQEKKTTMFENLKQINSIISGKELNAVFSNIKNAKSSLDMFCKKIKDQLSKNDVAQKAENLKVLQAQAEAEKPQPVVTAQAEPSDKPVNKTPKQNFENKQNKPEFSKPKEFSRPNPSYTNKQPYNKNGNYTPNTNPRYNNNNNTFNNNANTNRPNNNFGPKREGTFNKTPGGLNKTGGYAGKPNNNIVSFTNSKPKSKGFDTAFVPINTPKPSSLGANKAKTKVNDNEKKGLNIKEKIRLGYIRFDSDRDEDGVVRLKGKKRGNSTKQQAIEITHVVLTEDVLTVKLLSEKMGKPASEIIKKLLLLGIMYNINSVIDFPTAELIASEFGITLEHKVEKTYEEQLQELVANKESDKNAKFIKRPPVVTIMGHVDHGKTSLLDYIKKSHVMQSEAGGITQHIGAYSIKVNNSDITFIDTPGHAAFSDMRQRGATVADIAILIVAADDGIMPQTIEAIKHIQEAKTPMIVAINKIDKPTANIERIKQQLTEHDVLIEEWGGDTIYVPISAHTGEGIDKLLEMILLVSDINEFKANPKRDAFGTCIESKVDTGRGIVATIIIKDGTLKVGDYIVCGLSSGRVRAMTDYLGQNVKSAGPSMAVSVVGLNSVPSAGEMAYVLDEKLAKNLILERSNKLQIEKTQTTSGATLESFLSQNAEQETKVYKVIVKTDVQGTSEALTQTLEHIKNEEVEVSVISSGVGIINENDVLLAKTSNAQLIGFNTKLDSKARQLADRNGVDVKIYKVIYEAVDYVTDIIESMKTPKYKESQIGKVEVRQLFKISSLGVIAGSYVLEGVINRNSTVKVMRGDKEIAQSTVDTLQQQKDEAKQVKAGFECGIKLKGFNDIKVGDILVAFENVKI